MRKKPKEDTNWMHIVVSTLVFTASIMALVLMKNHGII